jgi:hypothetical protein
MRTFQLVGCGRPDDFGIEGYFGNRAGADRPLSISYQHRECDAGDFALRIEA